MWMQRYDRGRAEPEGGASAGVRLRVQGGQGEAQHSVYGAPADDVGRAAFPVGRDQQDCEFAA
jgi:hypothetical protein